jgi:hypothetical protein
LPAKLGCGTIQFSRSPSGSSSIALISSITGLGPVIVARFEHQFGMIYPYLLIYYYYIGNGINGQSVRNRLPYVRRPLLELYSL